MHEDLLDATACVEWVEAQLPSLEDRIRIWLDDNLSVEIKNVEPESPNNVIVGLQKEPLPLAFNVEVGCYINAIRSSLDLLATALAHRHGVPDPNSHYFPVAASDANFLRGNFKGNKLIRALPPSEKAIIDSINPYRGGNDLLWALHQLDIMRKHQRLLTVASLPARFEIIGWGLSAHYTPLSNGFTVVHERETVLGILAKNAPHYEMKFRSSVAINENSLSIRKPAIVLLREFASLARSIIALFDSR